MSSVPDCLAADGGGTRCRVASWCGGERVCVEVGSANVTTDFESGMRVLDQGFALLAKEHGQPLESWRDVPTYLGLAGVTGQLVADAVAERLPFTRVRVEDDRPSAIRAALAMGDGAVAHAGTGSFQAVQRKGSVRSAGGWGAVLGDQASAMWLGRESLAATLAVHDGLLAASPLSGELIARFGDTTGIVRFAREATPAAFGQLAPVVTDAAGAGDALALALLRRGAALQAEVLRSLGWRDHMTVVLTGGLAASYAEHFEEVVRRRVTVASVESIDGALSLARDLAQENIA